MKSKKLIYQFLAVGHLTFAFVTANAEASTLNSAGHFNDRELDTFAFLTALSVKSDSDIDLSYIYETFCRDNLNDNAWIQYEKGEIERLEYLLESKKADEKELALIKWELDEHIRVLGNLNETKVDVKPAGESDFCLGIRSQVTSASSVICQLKQKFSENCGYLPYFPDDSDYTVCGRTCSGTSAQYQNARLAKDRALNQLAACLSNLPPNAPSDACSAARAVYLSAVAAYNAAIAAYQECMSNCRAEIGDMPDAQCLQIRDDLEKAQRALRNLCSPFILDEEGNPIRDQNGQPIANPNAACDACQEVTSTGYSPIRCEH